MLQESVMSNTKEKVYALLNSRFGDDVFEDYENRETVFDCAIEYVECEDDLTCGCGVGPLMDEIKQWVNEFEAGKHNIAKSENFILSVKFEPQDLGFQYFQDAKSLKEVFPVVHQKPESYPVFAKEIISIETSKPDVYASVLSYIPLSKIKVVV
jgi:hypothetical protein